MLSRWKSAIFLLCLLPAILTAQEASEGFTVTTSPPGAEVSLIGAVTLNGITPVTFKQGLEGNYQVRVTSFGYETYKSSVFLQTGKLMTLTVRLHPKTVLKAAARSLLIPGWGQSYAGQKGKGTLLTLAAVGAVASFLVADANFTNKENEYNDMVTSYRNALTYDQKQLIYSSLKGARKSAYDAESVRRITIGAVIAVWGLNLLDVIFFFPEDNGSLVVNSVSFKPDFEQGGGQVVLSHRF